MHVLTKYGWIFLLVAVAGEMVVPFILAPFYKGYDHITMAISTLGCDSSPFRFLFRVWMLTAGVLFLLSTPGIYSQYCAVSKPLSIMAVLCVVAFAVGACICSCFFSVNETKDVVTTASNIHGAASAVGFLLLLLVPVFLAVLSFKAGDTAAGIVASVSFVLALVCFVLFIMADKPGFQNTALAREGLWQRLTLLFMYLPLAFVAAQNTLNHTLSI